MNQVIEIGRQQRGGTRLAERELTELAPNQVRVAMQAFSLNHRDLLIARGAPGCVWT